MVPISLFTNTNFLLSRTDTFVPTRINIAENQIKKYGYEENYYMASYSKELQILYKLNESRIIIMSKFYQDSFTYDNFTVLSPERIWHGPVL